VHPRGSNMKSDRFGLEIPTRIVLRGTNWVGDTIISLPAAREMRRIFPSSTLSFWGPEGLTGLVKTAGIADEIISFDGSHGGPTRRAFGMSRRLAAEHFDLAVLFQNAFESAFTAWLARVPLRAGYATDMRGPLLNVKVPLQPEIKTVHQVYYYLALTDHLEERFYDRASTRTGVPDCSILLTGDILKRARDLMVAQGIRTDRPIFVLCPGSVNSEAKRWPTDYFAHLADLLAERMDGEIVFLGAPGEADLIEEVRGLMRNPRAANLAGKADMVSSMAVMNLSRTVISNDTGSAHLAAAATARVLTIFGPTSAGATAPFSPRAHVIEGSAPCAPCRHYRCPEPDHPCMRSIEPESVLREVQAILAGERGPSLPVAP
jgi:heptosyltransferase-2